MAGLCNNAPCGHDFFQISIRDAVADIEKHSLRDHAPQEMVPFESNRHGWALAFKFKSPCLPRASQSNQPRKLCDRTIIFKHSVMPRSLRQNLSILKHCALTLRCYAGRRTQPDDTLEDTRVPSNQRILLKRLHFDQLPALPDRQPPARRP